MFESRVPDWVLWSNIQWFNIEYAKSSPNVEANICISEHIFQRLTYFNCKREQSLIYSWTLFLIQCHQDMALRFPWLANKATYRIESLQNKTKNFQTWYVEVLKCLNARKDIQLIYCALAEKSFTRNNFLHMTLCIERLSNRKHIKHRLVFRICWMMLHTHLKSVSSILEFLQSFFF